MCTNCDLDTVEMKIDKKILDELSTFKFCPFCEAKNSIEITTPYRSYLVKSRSVVLKGNQYVYKCEECGEGFTTTLSDDLSFKNFKQHKVK